MTSKFQKLITVFREISYLISNKVYVHIIFNILQYSANFNMSHMSIRQMIQQTINVRQIIMCITPFRNRNVRHYVHMMTSSNGNIFRVTGHLCGEFTGPTQRPVTRSFGVFFDLRLNKRLSKQSWSWWFEKLWLPLWRHRNEFERVQTTCIAYGNTEYCITNGYLRE